MCKNKLEGQAFFLFGCSSWCQFGCGLVTEYVGCWIDRRLQDAVLKVGNS